MNQRQAGGMGDELTNAALTGLTGMFGIALVLRAAGSVTAFLTGTPQPEAGAAAGIGVLFKPGDPATALGADGLNPVAYWLVSTALLGGLTAGIVWVWIMLHRHTRRTKTDPHRLAGTATSHEVKTAASAKALLHRATTLRPSLQAPAPQDVGYLLGASRGTKVWASVEDSILLIGPPLSGRGLHVVINAILDAPGTVVTTSTRPDNLTATLRARRRKGGPVAVFDPQHLAEGIPAGLRWSPIRGCDDPLTAMIDADPKPATAFGKESPLPSPPWPTPESPTQSPPNPTSSSTPRSSSPNTEPSTSSPPAQVPAHPLPWSPHSSRTSWKPPAGSPPAHPEHGSTRPCCSPSTRSGTSHPSHRYPC